MTDAIQSEYENLLARSLTEEELTDLTDSESAPAQVTYKSQDFDVAGLVKRLEKGQMLVPQFGGSDERVKTAGFQRSFVWTRAQMDRFVESLLLGYPVPGIFLVRQTEDNRLLILDGQQRLITLQRFYKGISEGKEFQLNNVGDDFRGYTYETLDESLQFKLDDTSIQATIVNSDGSKQVNEAIYQIFERLNSGGTQLTPHEIRVAIYAGSTIDYLEELNQIDTWRSLYGKKSTRIRDQELILRILAFYINGSNYTKPLKSFLNNFIGDHRNHNETVNNAGRLFREASDLLDSKVGKSALRRPGALSPNVAQSEAVFVGLMHAINENNVTMNIKEAIQELKSNENFIESTTRFTSDRDATFSRIELAKDSFRANQ